MQLNKFNILLNCPLESSAPYGGFFLAPAEGPFGPTGDSGGQTDGRTEEQTDGQRV